MYKNSRDKLTTYLCPQIESEWEIQIYLTGLPGLDYDKRIVKEFKAGLCRNQSYDVSEQSKLDLERTLLEIQIVRVTESPYLV